MSDFNPITEYPSLRRALYLIQWVVNLILGISAIVLTAMGDSPAWFLIVGAVFNFVWTYTGITAQANTEGGQSYESDPNLMVSDDVVLEDPYAG